MLPRFVMNAFYYYYIQNEQSADYFMIDYFINIAYEHIAKVTEDIDMIDYSQPQALRMADHRNVAYDEEVYSKLTEDTDLFKLTYKDHIARQNIIGRDTLFGFLCREYGV